MNYLFKTATLALVLALVLSLGACSTSSDDAMVVSEVLYFNSFESEDDLTDFVGNSFELATSVPNEGGNQSLFVAGGCVLPHAFVEIGPFDEDHELHVSFVSKADGPSSGFMEYYVGNNLDTRRSFIIEGSDWTEYRSSESLLLPAGERLHIEFVFGGFVAGLGYFDLLTVTEG